MKIFINTTSWAIVKQENETPILAGNNYVDQLKVYYDSNPSTQYFYPLLNILKPNDRKVGLISFDATSVEEPNPSTYTDDDNNTWYMFKFTLSSDNHQIDVSGKYQFTITTNYYNNTTGVILKQRNINTILSVVNAVTNDDNSVLILGSEPGVVVAELYALCQSLQTGVASLQISVSALTSNKADRDNTSQTIKAGIIKTHTLQGNGFGVLVDDEVSFNDIAWFTDGDGTNKWKIFYNSDGNLQFTSVTPAKKVEFGNVKVNEIHDGTDTSEIEMALGAINFYAKNWENPSQYKQIVYSYAAGLQVDEPTYNFNPTTKNYVDTKDALKLDKANVYNGLDKTANGYALDARQGKALKDSLDTLYNYVGYATGNDDDTTINKLREIFQFLAGEADDATLLSLLAGKQAKIDSDNKLSSDFVDDTNNTHKFVTAEEKQQIQTNADNIASHDTAINNRYTKTETDTLLATKQDVLTGSDSVDLTGNVASVKDKGITGDKLNLLSMSNIKNLATNDCGNISTESATAYQVYRNYGFNITQGKKYLVCAMFKKNANHTDTAKVVCNLRYSGTTYSNYTSIAVQSVTLSNDYQLAYIVFAANENKSDYFSARFYRHSAFDQEKVIDIDVKSMFVCEIPDGYNYQEIMDVVKKYDYLSNLDYLSNIHEIKSNFWDDKTILCYGDSLTHGAGGNGTTYPSELQTLLGSNYKVSNRGVGGETALQIGARQGGIQAMLQPMTIGTSNSNCEYKSIIGNITLNPLGYQSNAENTINPVIVDGKECTISSTSSTQAVIKSNSSEFTITRPMPILTASTKDKNKTLILWVGQNGWGSNDNQDLVNIIKNMIEYNGNDKYLVIGFSTGTTTSRADLDDLMVHSFGNHYINIREYLVNYGLDDNSLTPTEQDTTDISVGTVPTSLRSDGVHLNAYGYSSVAKCVYQYGKNNNLW